MYIIYAIVSKIDNRVYVGLTSDLVRRLTEHNSGSVFSTKGYRPWSLLYTEEAIDRVTARQREKYLKSGTGKEFLKKMRDNCIPR